MFSKVTYVTRTIPVNHKGRKIKCKTKTEKVEGINIVDCQERLRERILKKANDSKFIKNIEIIQMNARVVKGNTSFDDMDFESVFDAMPTKAQRMLTDLKKLREREDFHPEESAWEHVKIVCERAIKLRDMDLVMAAMFHDIYKWKNNKVRTSGPLAGLATAPLHDVDGALMVIQNSEFIYNFGADPMAVSWVCLNHMKIKHSKDMKADKRKFFESNRFYDKLALFSKCDSMLLDFDKFLEER